MRKSPFKENPMIPQESITSCEKTGGEGREALISYVAFVCRNWARCGDPRWEREAWLLSALRWIDALPEEERLRIARHLPWPSVSSLVGQGKIFALTV
jgi:hypothetical protein